MTTDAREDKLWWVSSVLVERPAVVVSTRGPGAVELLEQVPRQCVGATGDRRNHVDGAQDALLVQRTEGADRERLLSPLLERRHGRQRSAHTGQASWRQPISQNSHS